MKSEFILNSPQFNEEFFNIGDAYLIEDVTNKDNVLNYQGILVNCEPLSITFKVLDKKNIDYKPHLVDKTVPIYSIIESNIKIKNLIGNDATESFSNEGDDNCIDLIITKPQFDIDSLVVGNAYSIETKLESGYISKNSAILIESSPFELTFSMLSKNSEDYIDEVTFITSCVYISHVVDGYVSIKSLHEKKK